MFIALDADGKRTDIEEAYVSEEYFCPICNHKLIQKRGDVRLHHFAHEHGTITGGFCDGWHYDMSEWHRGWQNCFPTECQEVVVEKDGIKHRADVLLNNKTVVEFQHSQISREEFNARNDFYSLCGYQVVWLFDFQERRNEKQICEDDFIDFKYSWKWPLHVFDDYDPEKSKVQLYFQLSDVEGESFGIEHVIWKTNNCGSFRTEEGVAYNRDEFVKLMNNFEMEEKESTAGETKNTNEYQVQMKDIRAFGIGKSIMEIINSCEEDVIGVKNLNTGARAKISAALYRKNGPYNGKLQGYLGIKGSYCYYPDRRDVYYWYQKEWILEWKH